MEMLLKRQPSTEKFTHGDLYVDDVWECFVLEDVVREEKIHGETAIPAGRYRITLENSPRFGPNTLTVNGVKNFNGVRIHAGNTEKDTEGCPLVGRVRLPTGIGESRVALAALKEKVHSAIQNHETVWLEVQAAE